MSIHICTSTCSFREIPLSLSPNIYLYIHIPTHGHVYAFVYLVHANAMCVTWTCAFNQCGFEASVEILSSIIKKHEQHGFCVAII